MSVRSPALAPSSLLLVLGIAAALPSCGKNPAPTEPGIEAPTLTDTTCEGLFGIPSATTGLSDEQCAPVCGCDGREWTPPRYDDGSWLQPLRSWTLSVAQERILEDPYLGEVPERSGDEVCAVVIDDAQTKTYHLETFETGLAALEAGAYLTHSGACGACSSLADLATYIEWGDLTEPVRQCGIEGLALGFDATLTCLQELGFTPACADIWAFNTNHTGEVCRSTCISLLSDPYHTEDGGLNDCIQCDEDESGPIFKAYAGRTRRNSGLASALCRPCNTVTQVEHSWVKEL